MSKLHQKDKVFFSGINEQIPDSPFEDLSGDEDTYLNGYEEPEDDEDEDVEDAEEGEEEDVVDALPFAEDVFEL